MKKYIFSLLSIIYLMSAVVQPSRADVYRTSDSINCTIQVSEKSIKEVFSLIEKQTGLRFIHNATEAQLSKKISLAESNQPIDEVLKKIAKQSGLSFKRVDQTIYVQTAGKQIRVTGKVTDAQTGETLPGVSVKVKGSSEGTVTDINGIYHIEATENSTVLVFSFIGYITQELKASGTTLNVLLKADQAALKEVVVVGYGKQSRKMLTSSIASVQNKDFNKGAFSNPAQLLQGKVAGISITRSGDPNEAPSISLRGPSTLRTTGGAQEPFYVIDGVPGADYRLVSPDDIVSIDALKDASATAIYGTRAANGVIIITTKRGKTGQSEISYNAYAGVEKIANSIKMMDATQLNDYLKKNSSTLDPSDQKGANTDWQKEVSRTGSSQNHNVSLLGGYNQTTYSASINYFDNKGILKGSELSRLTSKVAVEQKAFNDRLKLGIAMNNSTSNSDIIPNQNIVLYNMLRYLPTVPVMQDGAYTENLQRVQYYNPVSLMANAYQKTKSKLNLISATAELKLPFGFTYNLNLSSQTEQVNMGSYNTTKYTLNPVNGEAYRSAFENTHKVGETFLNYNKTTGKHDINILAGYSLQQDIIGDGFQASNRNFASDDLGYLNIGLGSPAGNFRPDWGINQYQKLRLISYYSRAKYSFDNKYLLQLSVRRDGSSAFGENNKWGTFPSASIGWRIIEESFMKNQNLFNDLKLRASYGITGNSLGFDPLIAKIKYSNVGSFYNNGTFSNAIGPTQNANPDLKWEKTTMYNVGLDFSLFKGRLNGTLEAYNKKTNDLIYGYPVSTTQYFTGTLLANVGSISNKGYELTLDATPVQSSKFRWTTTLNVAHNTNKLVSLSNSTFKQDSIPVAEPGGQGQTGYKVQLLKTGYPVGQFFVYRYAGKNADGVSQFYDRTGKITTAPQFRDATYAGNAQPKLLFGFGNSFTYGNIDLNIFVRGSLGGKILNATLADLNRPGDSKTYNLPVSSANESIKDVNAYLYSDRYIESGSFLRLDNATLGYTFPKFTPGIRNLRLYVSGNNIATITGYKGIDPEISLGGLTPGIDNKNYYPRTRAFLFGLSASF